MSASGMASIIANALAGLGYGITGVAPPLALSRLYGTEAREKS
jgi:hypothetical protein